MYILQDSGCRSEAVELKQTLSVVFDPTIASRGLQSEFIKIEEQLSSLRLTKSQTCIKEPPEKRKSYAETINSENGLECCRLALLCRWKSRLLL